jgi:hypothetical protein
LRSEQQARLDQQQAAVRTALAAIDAGAFWLQWFGIDIDEMREELDDDPEALDRDDVIWNLDGEQFFEDYPLTPGETLNRVADVVLDCYLRYD